MKKLLNSAIFGTVIMGAIAISAPVMAAGDKAGAQLGDKAAGEAKSATCVGCHGVGGNSAIAINPKLAGQHADYIYKQLTEFKSKKRDNAIMYGMVAALSDQDMLDLAAYYASQPVSPGSASEDSVALGSRIYRAGNAETGVPACMGCHGPNGAGNPAAKFPRLSGQHAVYTVSQLKAYQNGTRANDMAEMMRTIAAKLTDKEIDAVAQYVAGLQ